MHRNEAFLKFLQSSTAHGYFANSEHDRLAFQAVSHPCMLGFKCILVLLMYISQARLLCSYIAVSSLLFSAHTYVFSDHVE